MSHRPTAGVELALTELLRQVPGAGTPSDKVTDSRLRRWESQRRHHARIEVAYVYHLGRALRARKAALKHGEYLPWVRRLGISERSAQRYTQIAALIDEVLAACHSLPAAAVDGVNLLDLPKALRAALDPKGGSSTSKPKGWNPPAAVQRHPVQRRDAIEGLSSIPDGTVDLILTDPPWKVQGAAPRGRTTAHRLCKDRWFDTIPLDYFRPFFAESCRVLRPDRLVYCFVGWQILGAAKDAMEAAGFEVGHPIVWHKTGSMGLGHRFRRCHELILFGTKGKPALPDKALPDVIACDRVSHHETNISVEKPLDLLEVLIRQAALEPGSLVVDPFAGTGSTGLAAANLGHQFVGFDVSRGAVSAQPDLRSSASARPRGRPDQARSGSPPACSEPE